MGNIKAIVAENLIKYRKANGLTQIALAEKINYSDKAVSRWEKAEVTPDIETLAKIAEVLNVPVDAFLYKTDNMNKKTIHFSRKSNKMILSLLSISGVWILATIAFVTVFCITKYAAWQAFICACPVSAVLCIIFTAMWGKKLHILLSISALLWTALVSIYICLLQFNLWTLFFIGAPSQITIILVGCLVRKDRRPKMI